MNYNIRRMIFLIIALIWAIVIFAFSAKPGDESENQSIKVGMTVCNIFVPGFDNLQELHTLLHELFFLLDNQSFLQDVCWEQ